MRFVVRRLGFFLVTLWATLTVNFLIPRLLPGDPAIAALSRLRHATPETLRALEAEFGAHNHDSFISQYFQYFGNSLTGHFGRSLLFQPLDVSTLVMQALPWTLGLVGVTTVMAFVLGTVVGMVGAWRRGGRLDSVIPPIFVVLSAFTPFWVGMLLVLAFAITLGVLPLGNGFDVDLTVDWSSLRFIGNVLAHSILPGFTLLITTIGTWILTMRNNMITTLAEDYVRMARAKGLPSWRIMWSYAGRNAILPNLTGFAMSLGFVVSGAILVEYVFNYPGLGYMLLQAVHADDFPLMQALFMVITLAVLLAVLLSDFVTAWLDPRTRAAEA